MASRNFGRLLTIAISARQCLKEVASNNVAFRSAGSSVRPATLVGRSTVAGVDASGTTAGRFLAQMSAGASRSFQPLGCFAAMQHVVCATTTCLMSTSTAAVRAARDELLEVDENDEPPGRIPALREQLHPTEAVGLQRKLSPEEWRSKHDIRVDDPEAPDPAQTFEDTGFPQSVVSKLRALGYGAPTEIQAQSWTIAAQGRDLVAVASTGSGKTLGFLLPGMLAAAEARRTRGGRSSSDDNVRMLVLAPTRELARQIFEQAQRFAALLRLRCVCLYGGESKAVQGRALRGAPDVVVATPGRLLDFVESQEVSLAGVQTMVLDEADRMLDMGFEEQLKDIAAAAPRDRQTLLFSATWPKEVKMAARRFCANKPVHIMVGAVQEQLVANKNITQLVKIVDSNSKTTELLEFLRTKPRTARVIVFTGTKAYADMLATRLIQEGMSAAAIHGDKQQNVRDYTLEAFRSGRTPILVATDVAARGLDIQNVAAVVNYDWPMDPEMYVHRIGRTGRAGASGESFTLLTKRDANAARHIMQVMQQVGQVVPEDVQQLASQRQSPEQSRHGRGSFQRGGSSSSSGGSSWGNRGNSRGGSDSGSSRGGQQHHHAGHPRDSSSRGGERRAGFSHEEQLERSQGQFGRAPHQHRSSYHS